MAALICLAAPLAAASLALASPLAAPARDVPQASQPAFSASPAVERWRPFIAEASQRFGIPQAWIAAVMQAENDELVVDFHGSWGASRRHRFSCCFRWC